MHILFAGGGTAGHINPALAVADYIKQRHPDAKISYIGTKDKLESVLVPKKGYDFYTIEVAGFKRKISLKSVKANIDAAVKAVTASKKARELLKELKPDIVVGTGGYVSGPVLREAAKLKIKTLSMSRTHIRELRQNCSLKTPMSLCSQCPRRKSI